MDLNIDNMANQKNQNALTRLFGKLQQNRRFRKEEEQHAIAGVSGLGVKCPVSF
jgi:hypothetical protein